MTFETKTWVDEEQAQPGDPELEAAELNRIEQGIADAASGARTIVLGAADPVPPGTPAGTVIVRTAD